MTITDEPVALTGNLVVTLFPTGGSHTYCKLDRITATDLHAEITTMFTDDGRGTDRVVLQYQPGPEGNEAGSRFFDYDDLLATDDDDRAERGADAVLDYVREIEAGFRSGLRFVP